MLIARSDGPQLDVVVCVSDTFPSVSFRFVFVYACHCNNFFVYVSEVFRLFVSALPCFLILHFRCLCMSAITHSYLKNWTVIFQKPLKRCELHTILS
jgi:hypothetical protein